MVNCRSIVDYAFIIFLQAYGVQGVLSESTWYLSKIKPES